MKKYIKQVITGTKACYILALKLLAISIASKIKNKNLAPVSSRPINNLDLITHAYSIGMAANSKLTGLLSIKLLWKIMIGMKKMSMKSFL